MAPGRTGTDINGNSTWRQWVARGTQALIVAAVVFLAAWARGMDLEMASIRAKHVAERDVMVERNEVINEIRHDIRAILERLSRIEGQLNGHAAKR